MGLGVAQDANTDNAQHSPPILRSPHAARNFTFSSGSASEERGPPISESRPGPLTVHSTLVRDIFVSL